MRIRTNGHKKKESAPIAGIAAGQDTRRSEMSKKMYILSILFLLAMLILGGCGSAPATPTPSAPNMPNPASAYCEEHGGTLEIVTAEDGSQSGLCHFPDGSVCEEWAYFRGECALGTPQPLGGGPNMANPASVYCEEHDGTLEIVTAADGSQSGLCKFSDGTACDEWAYFRGECASGQATPTQP
jgi:putative hemolysin